MASDKQRVSRKPYEISLPLFFAALVAYTTNHVQTAARNTM